jgi:hypothetical protein
MKLSWRFILPSLLCSASAASRTGYVYVWDPDTQPSETQLPSITPESARLILAQRLGVSQFHAIKPNQALIQHINKFGGRPAPLFSEKSIKNAAHALVWIEGAEDVQSMRT